VLLLLGHWSARCFLVLAWVKSPFEKWPCAELQLARCRCRCSATQTHRTRTSSDLWCLRCREYKNKLCSLEFIRRHGYLRESVYQQRGGLLCNQHQWSRDRCHTHLCTLQTRANKELVISYAIISRSLLWAACTCRHIQLQVYLVTEFTSPQANGGL